MEVFYKNRLLIAMNQVQLGSLTQFLSCFYSRASSFVGDVCLQRQCGGAEKLECLQNAKDHSWAAVWQLLAIPKGGNIAWRVQCSKLIQNINFCPKIKFLKCRKTGMALNYTKGWKHSKAWHFLYSKLMED